MSAGFSPHVHLLDELDSRQDAVLTELDRLNHRIESLLNTCTPANARTESELHHRERFSSASSIAIHGGPGAPIYRSHAAAGGRA